MTSVVVATYNEVENVRELLDRINGSLKDVEVIIVDDDSPDGTSKVARKHSEERGYDTKVIVRENKRGLCGAVLKGVEEAGDDIICVMDGGLQHPPEKIPDLADEIRKGADIAVGSRYTEGGDEDFSLTRKVISRGAAYLARLLLPTKKIKDPVSGFFAARKKVFSEDIEHQEGYKILLEILSQGDFEATEVPYEFEKRGSGESSFGLKTAFLYIRRLASLMRRTGEMKKWILFTLVGSFGVVIDQSLLWILTEFAGLYYIISSFLSGSTAVTSNFFLNDRLTFRERSSNGVKNKLYQLFHYHWTRAFGLPLRLFVLWLFTEIFGVWYFLSNLIAIASMVVWGFLSAKHIVWKR